MRLLGVPIRLLVCDMAGTVINEGGIIYKAIDNTLKGMGYSSTEEERKLWFGKDKKEVLCNHIQKFHNNNNIDQIVDTAEIKLIKELEKEYFENTNIKLMDGTLDLFDTLRTNNVKVALNTGYPKALQKKIIGHFDLNNHIDSYISSEEVIKGRPYPFMIDELSRRTYTYKRKSIVKVGDTMNDILEGINSNCGLSIGVLSGAGKKSDLDTKANMVLNNISDLNKYLQQ